MIASYQACANADIFIFLVAPVPCRSPGAGRTACLNTYGSPHATRQDRSADTSVDDLARASCRRYPSCDHVLHLSDRADPICHHHQPEHTGRAHVWVLQTPDPVCNPGQHERLDRDGQTLGFFTLDMGSVLIVRHASQRRSP